MKTRDPGEIWLTVALVLCLLATIGFTLWGWMERTG